MKRSYFLAVALNAVGSAQLVLAQSSPDAGAILRQIEGAKGPALSVPATEPQGARVAPQADGSGQRTRIDRFVFVGNTKLGDAALAQAISGFTGKDLSLAQIREAAAVIANVYRQAGWVAAVIVPEQDVTEGNCRLEILESVAADIHVRSADGLKAQVPDALLIGLASNALPKGEIISTQALDRAILLAGDIPGVHVEGVLTPGEIDKSSTLELQTTVKPSWSGQLSADNEGSRSTGADRLQAGLSYANPAGIGDLAGLSMMETEGINYLRASYGFPLGYSGLRGSASLSDMNYKLVGSDFSALGASGTAQTLGLELAYPILRGRQSNVNASFATELRRFENDGAAAVTSKYAMQSNSLSVSASSLQNITSLPGVWSASAGFVWGDVDLGGSPNQAQDAAGPASAGAFSKLRWSLSRQQTLPNSFSLEVSLSGQSASKNLDSSEKMQLGGSDGIRAYPTGEASGNDGVMARIDMTRPLGGGFAGGVFYDWGSVRQTHTAYSGMPAPDEVDLQGAGVTLQWSGDRGQGASLTYSKRIGSNPLAQANGSDQDGSLVSDRVWLAVHFQF